MSSLSFGFENNVLRTPYLGNGAQQTEKNEEESFLKRMSDVLSYRIDERCAELTVAFERGSRKDLQTYFPSLVDSIFGPQGTASWELRNIVQECNHTEFNVLVNFLKPLGPLFKLIYSLLQDPGIKYDFNLCYLPTKVRQLIESSNIHPFYGEAMKYNSQSQQIVCLHLNPFDYFMFHFGYYLINPCHQRLAAEEQWNSVYYTLCVEYLMHFFPISVDCQILPIVNHYFGKLPMHPMQLQKPFKSNSLLKKDLFKDNQSLSINSMHHAIDKHPKNDIWRSETMLMVLVDLWLSNDLINYCYGLNMSAHYLELPSSDYIRIIRVAVKHLHAFASLANIDSSPLGELRKITMPIIQGKMYIFLRNLVYRWPLDESFRLVLELWLSFIQPWRYSADQYLARGGIYKSSTNITQNNETRKVEEEWMPFIVENLLSYVVIYQQLLPRFTRVDLSSPKNAQMLFRLTKVFNQSNLVDIIKKIESYIVIRPTAPSHAMNAIQKSVPPLSPTSNWCISLNDSRLASILESPRNPHYIHHGYENVSEKYNSTIRQKMYELEGPNFYYKPLFLGGAAPEVFELLQMIKAAEVKASTLLYQRLKEEKGFGFFSFFYSSSSIDKVSKIDRQKAPVFLRCSIENLIEMFSIENFDNFKITPEMSDIAITSTASTDDSFPNVVTPERVRHRIKQLHYDGDPDLISTCSYENKMAVEVLFNLSKKINENYSQLIHELYYDTGFKGRFAQNFIESPKKVFKFEKKDGESKRVSSQLPPRISLRPLANSRRLLFILAGTFAGIYFGFGPVSFILSYVFVVVIYFLLKATFGGRSDDFNITMMNDTLNE